MNAGPSLNLTNWIYFSVSPSVMAVVRFYTNEVVTGRALQRAAKLYPQLSITTELCYNVELTGEGAAACRLLMMTLITEGTEFMDSRAPVKNVNPPCVAWRFSVYSVYPLCHDVIFSSCRLWESQCRAEGGSPLVVSPSPAGRAAVWEAKPHRGQRGEAGGDRTEVPLHLINLMNDLSHMLLSSYNELCVHH